MISFTECKSSLEFVFEIQEIHAWRRSLESRQETLEKCAPGRASGIDASRGSGKVGSAKGAEGKGCGSCRPRLSKVEKQNSGRTEGNHDACAQGPLGFQECEVMCPSGSVLQSYLQSPVHLLYDFRTWQSSRPSIGRS